MIHTVKFDFGVLTYFGIFGFVRQDSHRSSIRDRRTFGQMRFVWRLKLIHFSLFSARTLWLLGKLPVETVRPEHFGGLLIANFFWEIILEKPFSSSQDENTVLRLEINQLWK